MPPQFKYTSIPEYLNSRPKRRVGELSNDIDGTFDDENPALIEAIHYAEEQFESYITARNDYRELPVRASDGTTPRTIKKYIHTVATWYLYDRRDITDENTELAYQKAQDWINDVVNRKANIPLKAADKTQIDDRHSFQPVFDRGAKSSFDDQNLL